MDSKDILEKIKNLGGSRVDKLISVAFDAVSVMIQNQMRIEEKLDHLEQCVLEFKRSTLAHRS